MSKFNNILIRASAGTGKTFQLSNRFLGLLHSGAPVDQILATTFTRKAAGEILDRVMQRLAAAANDDRACAALAAELDDPALSRARCLILLQQLTRNLHRLRVSTLDSFFSQIASSFSLELALPAGWRIIDQLHDRQLRNEAIELLLRDHSARDVRRIMNLITRGDAERSVSELVRSTVDDLYSLFLETDEEAWRRIPESRLMSSEDFQAAIHHLENAPLPDDSRFVKAHTKDVAAARAGDWETFISTGLSGKVVVGAETYYKKPIPGPTYDAYERLTTHAKNVLVNQLAQQTYATYELLERFDAIYRRLKFEAHAMRFEDVTRALADRQEFAEVERLEHRLDAQISHLLFDEFQDTSLAQWQVVRPFAERVTQTGGQQEFYWLGGQQSFFCVGDVKQAIYGWRGGKSEIFDALEAHLDGLDHLELSHSYRSAPPVIETVNQVFGKIHRHSNLGDMEPAVAAWKNQFVAHTTARTELAGYTCLETAARADEGMKQADVTLRYAAQRIAEIVEQAPGCGVGVLVRRNRAVAQLIYELRQLDVAASEEGGNPLTDSVAVQVVLSLLRIGDHPGDTIARFHLQNSPIGEQVGLTDYRDDEQATELARRVRRRLLDDGYGPALHHWTSLLEPFCSERDQSRMRQLVEMAYQYEATATLRTTDFVRHIEAERVSDPTTASVRVMTIHQAKGLQFDIVVLPDLDAQLVGQPNACVVGQSDDTQPVDKVCLHRNSDICDLLPAEMQQLFVDDVHQRTVESLCVLYVAITRPVHALHMVIAPSPTNERSLHKTFAGLVRAALTDGEPAEPETVLHEHGDVHWSPQAAPSDVIAGALRKTPRPVDIPLAEMPAGRRVGLERQAPSGLEGGERIQLSQLLRIDNTGALARGSAIHACFEQIDWLDDGLPGEDQLRTAAAAVEGADLNVDEILRDFNAMLDHPEIAGALRRDSYRDAAGVAATVACLRLEVHNERRFAVRDNDRLLSGAIDRLVLMYDSDQLVAAEVIDYKTDAVPVDDPDELEATIEHYRPQQEAYRDAVSKMFHLDREKISARLLLVGPGVVRNL
ncbi:MAG: UvrD-helicase domain-containing protein [Pirellulaceae bacterium]|nr:UvrD-helicase domain-containing protein [Pirellulaceae bacterium]